MSELICRAEKARVLAGDPGLPKWDRLHQALAAFSGLRLDNLPDWAREEIETTFALVNRILATYPLEEAEDYQIISDADLNEMLGIVDLAAARLIDGELERIIDELDADLGKLPVATIREVRKHSDLMVPRLINVLNDTISNARQGELPDGNAHFFAIFLLSEFNAKEAFPVILEAISLPGDLPFDLFGDAITSTLAPIMAQFADDGEGVADAMIRNPDVDQFVRWECAQAYVYFVRDGKITREEAVERLRQHLNWAMAEEDVALIGCLICVLNEFAPKEALDDIKEAYDRNLVDTFLIDFESVEKGVAEGEEHFRKALERCPETGIRDTIEELQGWSCFAEKPKQAPAPPPTPAPQPVPSQPHFAMPSESSEPVSVQHKRNSPRVGRNDPCPCGSGKKFKKCCLSGSRSH